MFAPQKVFHNASIKRKLTLILMAVSSVTVLLTTLAMTIIGYYNLKYNIRDELLFTAASVGDRNTAALLFDERLKAQENLRVFSVNNSILLACLYKAQGEVFAIYRADETSTAPCPQPTAPMAEFGNNRLRLFQPIIKMGDKVGSIYIESNLQALNRYIRKQMLIALGVTLAVLIISYMLSRQLQLAISAPVLLLADTARRVTSNRDYSIRAALPQTGAPDSENEIDILVRTFNTMLSDIEERDRQLLNKTTELEKAKDAAEAANRSKSQFIANISHELRTPLNAIIGFSSILMNQLFGALGNEKYLEYAHDINYSGAHLLDIINDILDLSKAEAGKLDLVIEEINVEKAIRKCITILSERAAQGNISITTDVPRGLPYLKADRLRFIQVVLNMLSNAVKFTEEGGQVNIKVRTDAEGKDAHYFYVTVSDTGIGMEAQSIEKAFQSFGQIDSGLNRKYEGTGLGLPLSKKLMELHNGSIKIDSILGEGTTVTLTFPANLAVRSEGVNAA